MSKGIKIIKTTIKKNQKDKEIERKCKLQNFGNQTADGLLVIKQGDSRKRKSKPRGGKAQK